MLGMRTHKNETHGDDVRHEDGREIHDTWARQPSVRVRRTLRIHSRIILGRTITEHDLEQHRRGAARHRAVHGERLHHCGEEHAAV